MCDRYPEQQKKIEELYRSGYDLLTYLDAFNGDPEARIAVLGKPRGAHGTDYIEVNPDGSVNNEDAGIGYPND